MLSRIESQTETEMPLILAKCRWAHTHFGKAETGTMLLTRDRSEEAGRWAGLLAAAALRAAAELASLPASDVPVPAWLRHG